MRTKILIFTIDKIYIKTVRYNINCHIIYNIVKLILYFNGYSEDSVFPKKKKIISFHISI